jgi:hypothetical protein
MNCPNCNSANVVPAHQKIRCQDCEHSFETPANEDAEAAQSTPGPHLIKCPACAREVNSQAMRCPSCGQPLASAVIATAAVTIVKRILFGIAMLIALYIIVRGFVSIALEN